MLIKMRLNDNEFNKIIKNQKSIEVRLADKKRSKLKKGDLIEFTNIKTREILIVEVVEIKKFNSFYELYNFYDINHFGEEIEQSMNNIYDIYRVEQEKKYGALAIKFKRRV